MATNINDFEFHLKIKNKLKIHVENIGASALEAFVIFESRLDEIGNSIESKIDNSSRSNHVDDIVSNQDSKVTDQKQVVARRDESLFNQDVSQMKKRAFKLIKILRREEYQADFCRCFTSHLKAIKDNPEYNNIFLNAITYNIILKMKTGKICLFHFNLMRNALWHALNSGNASEVVKSHRLYQILNDEPPRLYKWHFNSIDEEALKANIGI